MPRTIEAEIGKVGTDSPGLVRWTSPQKDRPMEATPCLTLPRDPPRQSSIDL